MDEAIARTRTVSWQDPQRLVDSAQGMSGLDFLTAMGRGDVPPAPVMQLVGFQLVEVVAGRIVFTMEPSESHYNAAGVVHGGVVSTLLDTALGCAIYSTLPLGVRYATLELHVNFLRPLTVQSGPVRVEGESIHVGRSIATAQARLTDGAGKLYAHGTTTCQIMRPA